MKTTIYEANSKTHFFKELSYIFRDIKDSQFLAKQIATRDISAQYRQSLLGIFWALAPVISTSLIWIFLSNALELTKTSIPKPLFIIIGTTLWTIFTDCINNPTNSMNNARGIIAKINFPKEALLVSGIYKTLFSAFIKILLVILFLIYFGITPNMSLIYFPLYILAFILLGTAIGVIIAPIGLLYSDVGKGLQLVFTFLMYATPVVYAAPRGGDIFAKIFEYNPLTPLINSARNSLTGFPLEQSEVLWYTLIFSIVLLSIGLVLFRNSMNILIEKIAG